MSNRYLAAIKSLGRARLRNKVEYLILHVTSRCNAQCRMCFNAAGMAQRGSQSSLAVAEYEQLATHLRLLPQLTLSGGEPLLRDDLADITKAFYANAETRFFTLPTNALEPTRLVCFVERFLGECPLAFLNVCLPFYGEPAQFNDILGVSGAYERFRETYTALAALRKSSANVSCVLNFVMSKSNHASYESVIDQAIQTYPDVPFGISYARGATRDADAVDFPVESYIRAQEYLRKRRRSSHRANPYALVFDSIGHQMAAMVVDIVRGKRKRLNCRAGKRCLVIYENGCVCPCEMLDVVGIPPGTGAPVDGSMGTLGEFGYDLDALRRSARASRLVSWVENHDCACTWECGIYSAIIHSPWPLLRLGLNVAKTMTHRALHI